MTGMVGGPGPVRPVAQGHLPAALLRALSQPMSVAGGEQGIVRVFGLGLDKAALDNLLAKPAEAQPLVIERMLGARLARPDRVDLIRLADLGPMGLAGYLAEGHDVPPAALATDRARLDRLTGAVMLVDSTAFGGAALSLNPDPELRFLGAYPTALAAAARLTTPERPRPEILQGPAAPRLVSGRQPGWLALLAVLGLLALYLLFRAL